MGQKKEHPPPHTHGHKPGLRWPRSPKWSHGPTVWGQVTRRWLTQVGTGPSTSSAAATSQLGLPHPPGTGGSLSPHLLAPGRTPQSPWSMRHCPETTDQKALKGSVRGRDHTGPQQAPLSSFPTSYPVKAPLPLRLKWVRMKQRGGQAGWSQWDQETVIRGRDCVPTTTIPRPLDFTKHSPQPPKLGGLFKILLKKLDIHKWKNKLQSILYTTYKK